MSRPGSPHGSAPPPFREAASARGANPAVRCRQRGSLMTTRGSCRSESVVHVKRWLSWALAAAVVLTAAGPAHAQAVYGSISGTITDPSGAALPGATVTITGLERQTTDTVVSQASGLYLKERLQPGTYEVKAEVSGFKAAVVSTVRVNVDSQSKVDLRLELGEMTEAVTVTAAEGQLLKTDRADVAVDPGAAPARGAAGARPQLHEVHPADAGHAAARLEPREQREPAGLDADHGQRPALQRHRLPARRHREPRPHPRHHRHQPDARVDRRVEDHLAELRRRVRPGDGGRRLGPHQVGHQPDPRQRLRVPPERQVPGPQPVHAAGRRERDHRPGAARDQARPVRRVHRRADQEGQDLLLRRLPGLALHGRRQQAADGADGARAHGRPVASTASTSSIR